jgi:site-specific DNA-methyltransferase (adenine-specific)
MLTKRQKQVLDFIKNYKDKRDYAPSLEEIKKHLRLSSVSTAHYHVQALQNSGYLRKDENQPRALDVFAKQKLVQIPLLGRIAAGAPIEAIEDRESIAVPQDKIKPYHEYFALKVIGKSMVEENIDDGDIVLIKRQTTANNGDRVVAILENNEATLKKFFKLKNKVKLEPANPDFSPIFATDIKIQGIVVDIIKGAQVKETAPHKEELDISKVTSFKNNTVTIYNGDCLKVLPAIKSESIDLIFADPPYNLGKDFGNGSDKWNSFDDYFNWCKLWIDECVRTLKSNGTLYIMNSTQNMPHIDLYISRKIRVMNRIIWHYDSSGVQAKRKFGSLYEPILMAVKNENNYTFNSADIQIEAKTGAERQLIDYRKKVPTPYNTKKTPGNVWQFPRVRFRMSEYEDHPAQKPEKLLERIILASSNPNEVILDPFAGTFTTCATAQKYGRKSIGIEANEEYFKVGLRRLGLTNKYNGEYLRKIIKKKTNNRNRRDHVEEQAGSLF